jgi:predicted nucleotidyltransferase
MEVIKTAIKVGNSAGVLLPRKWLGSEVKIILRPLNIEEDILKILLEERILQKALGIYIVGSYARNEQTIDSDVDILVITSDINQRLKRDKYEIICISKKDLDKQINENALPLLAMIKEAKIITNEDLIKNIDFSLNKSNLKYHIETTKSAMKIVEKDIEISKEIKGKVSDASAYSIILRLRTLYIIDCLRKNKLWSKKEFLKLVKNISGSNEAYERYLSSKNKNTLDYELPINEAEKLKEYIERKIAELEKLLPQK